MKKLILTIDDVALNRCALVLSLRDNYDVIEAASGEEGIKMAIAFRPHLILLDILMPGLDGFDTARLLKRNPITSNIPIVFVTALNGDEYRTVVNEVGGVDIIVKPFSPMILKSRIQNYLL